MANIHKLGGGQVKGYLVFLVVFKDIKAPRSATFGLRPWPQPKRNVMTPIGGSPSHINGLVDASG